MQTFLLNIYENIKNKLCQRRNNRPIINKFAVIERTDVLVRKVQESSVVTNQFDDLREMRLPNKNTIEIKQQPQLPQVQQKSIPVPAHAKPSTYKLYFDDSQHQTQSQNLRQTIIHSHLTIDSYNNSLSQTYKRFKFLQEQDLKRRKHFWKHIYQNYSSEELDQDISGYIDQDEEEQNNDVIDARALEMMYQKDIVEVRELKYTREMRDYPEIEFESYKTIRELWALGRKNPNYVIKQMKLKFLQKLTARSFRTLSFSVWLNDQIINGYLQMLDTKSSSINKPYKVLNSFFAQTTFSKSQQIITRALKRKNITPRNTIIIAINNGNHWFFAKIMNSKVIVYDSIKKYPSHYLSSSTTKTIFQNILRFAESFYGARHQIQVDEEYPQQENSSDCGMFLLCGIKDIVREYREWSFSQFDINYKRVLVAKEFFDEEVSGF